MSNYVHIDNNTNVLKISDAARVLGVSTKTLRRWEKKGILNSRRSPTGQRFYTPSDLQNIRDRSSSEVPIKKIDHLYKLIFTVLLLSVGVISTTSESKELSRKFTDTGIGPQVLAATDSTIPSISDFTFSVNVPAKFGEAVTFLKDIVAPNVVYSVNGNTGNVDLTLEAGTGVTVDGLKVTNSDTGTSQKIFKTIKLGSTSFDAGSNTDTLEFTSSGGVTLSLNTTDKKLNIDSAAPNYALSGWTDAGTTVGLTTTTDSVVFDTVTFGNATITNGESIIPDTDLGSDLGSTLKRFNNLWVANINSNSSQSFSGQTTFSYAPTDTTISQSSVLINPTSSVANGQLLGLGIAGYQRALIDADGDLILGYNSLTSTPATAYPLDIYGHSGTRVAYIDTSGNLTLGTSLGSTGALTITPLSGSNLNVNLATTGDFAVNTNQLYVDTSAARVGIGTTSPGSTLEVNGLIGVGGSITFNGSSGSRIRSDSTGLISVLTGTGGAYGTLQVGDGSVSAPSFRFGNDTDTGLYSANSNTELGIGVGGSDRIRINSTGNVGIGTTAPTSKLHVSGAVTGKALSIFDETGDQALLTASASGVTKFIIDHAGNVGIGTTSPLTSLHLKTAVGTTITDLTGKNLILEDSTSMAANVGGSLLFYGNYTGTTPTTAAGIKAIKTNGTNGEYGFDLGVFTRVNGGNNTEKLRVTTDGKVGIGTASPGKTLEVYNATAQAGIKIASSGTGTDAAVFFYTSNAGQSGGSPWTVGVDDSDGGKLKIDTGNGVGGSTKLTITNAGNVGIGTSSPVSKLAITGATTGKALSIFDETGDQALLTASASGVTKLSVLHNGLVNGSAGGLATYTKAGTISDTDFTDTAVDGLMGFDSTDGRLYIRNAGAWSYIAKTAGFQIPDFESVGLSEGDFLMPYVEKKMTDGAVHGLYAKWSDVKDTLLADFSSLIKSVQSQIIAMTKKFTTKEICLADESNNETCIKKNQLDELIKLLPTPTATQIPPVENTIVLPSSSPTPEVMPIESPTTTQEPTPVVTVTP